MAAIRSCELPNDALLRKYLQGGAYADCYVADVNEPYTQAEYVEAFYTTALFKVERWLLARFAARPSTDEQARQLARGQTNTFAAWSVEGRRDDQLLLCDFQGRTRSWLMCVPAASDRRTGPLATRLYFGSAVVPVVSTRTGNSTMGWPFKLLLGFHKLYSRVLLRAAISRLAGYGRGRSS